MTKFRLGRVFATAKQVISESLATALLTLIVAFPAAAHTWKQLNPTGPLPEPRELATAVYDPASNRLILFGGFNPDWSIDTDVWVLTKADGSRQTVPRWIRFSPDTPLSRGRHSAVYNANTNRMIVFGGSEVQFGSPNNEVWLLINANGVEGIPQWQQLSIAPGPRPAARTHQAAVYDLQNNRMIIFGGGASTGYLNDTWVLINADGTADQPPRWLRLSPSGSLPAKRDSALAAYDPTTNQMLIFSGYGVSNDLWVLSNANGTAAAPPRWTRRTAQGVSPEPRNGSAVGFNPSSNRFVLFGGTGEDKTFRDTWLLRDAFSMAPRWIKRTPLDTVPPALSQMASAYSPEKDKLIMTTGDRDPVCCDYVNSTYVLSWATK